jgi:hypothetical protein
MPACYVPCQSQSSYMNIHGSTVKKYFHKLLNKSWYFSDPPIPSHLDYKTNALLIYATCSQARHWIENILI